MAFDVNRRADLFVSVEVSPSPAKRTPANPSHTAAQPHAESFYEQQTRLMQTDVSEIVAEGRELRLESERLCAWARFMGEGTDAATWKDSRANYAANARLQLRERAAKLKSTVDARCENPARVLDLIFSNKFRGQYPEDLAKQARAELGI
jgi:hypothetical protein